MYVCLTVSYFFVTIQPGVAGWRLKPAQRGSKRRGFCEGGRFPQLPINYYLLPTCKFATLIYQILGSEMSVRAPPLLSPYVFVQLPAVYLLLLTSYLHFHFVQVPNAGLGHVQASLAATLDLRICPTAYFLLPTIFLSLGANFMR